MKILSMMLVLQISLGVLAESREGEWRRYPYQAAGSEIELPRDEGAHRGIPNMEWWYVVMHLKGEASGDRYSVLVTHFNNQLRLFTVTNLDKKIHTSGATLGLLNAAKGQLNIVHKTKYGADIFRSRRANNGTLLPFEYELKTHHDKMNISAHLKSNKRPLMVAGDGYMAVGSSGFSYYYSLTDLEVVGELQHLGFKEKVKGKAWMDHQWGPFLVSPFEFGRSFETYEWFCVQLENGMELMISNIYDRHYHLPMSEDYGGVDLVLPNGNATHSYQRNFKRTHFWRDPISGHTMSMGWTLEVPEWDLTLVMRPDMLEQMVQLPWNGSFWEGSVNVEALVAGVPVKGKAFGELIHHFEKPQIEFFYMRQDWHRDEMVSVEWKIINPDDGNPLHFNIYLIQNGVEKLLQKNATSTNYKAKLASILINSTNRDFKFKVRALSVDESIVGEAETQVLHLK